jgi:uncharacterized 2Fe-2S/4Fe-4S cluster protein (DUF4445 family)
MKSGHIYAKASAGNGQIRYGADVINRIIETTKENGIEKLQNAIIKDTMNPMIENLCKSAGIKPEKIQRVCIAGNTTMNHLFLGVNANYLRQEPFFRSFFELKDMKAQDVHLAANSEADL